MRLFETPGLVESSSPELNLFFDIEEHLEEETIKIMTETIEQYMSKTRGNYGSIETFDGLAVIQAQLNNLGREIKKDNKKVYVVQDNIEQQGQDSTNATTEILRILIEDRLWKKTLPKPWLSSKRHEENSNIIKEIRASTDAAIRNQGASIKTLEIQIGQIVQGFIRKRNWRSAWHYRTKPRDHVKLDPQPLKLIHLRYAV
ncbi:hypothetical protein Tco_0321226 [Tanacetum coccineum]